ncbi:MAG: hypothetical protein JWO38_7294 [Gemmataceae bacterium]|nr:hypothetical protein [Gemmataceae bacterium]
MNRLVPPFPLSLALVVTLSAGDWPQWRGPNRDGVVPAGDAPKSWPKALTFAWKVEVGEGHSGPVVVGDRVFLHSRVGDAEVVRCVALADGKPAWERRYPAPVEVDAAAEGHGKGPKATPAVAAGRVFTLGLNGTLTAWDAATGDQLWQHTFAKEFKKRWPPYGAATSPLVAGDVCIVWVGGTDPAGGGKLIAVDVKTGERKWAGTLDDGPGYASPVIAELAGKPQLVTQSRRHLCGFDPATGKILWEQKFTTGYDQNSVTPVVYKDLVIHGGYERPTAALRLRKTDGPGLKPEPVWELREHTLYMSTPVVAGDRLFGLSTKGGGTLFCATAGTGDVVWTSPGRVGPYAALIAAGSFVLVQTTGADLWVLRADGAKFDPVAEYKLADTQTWAHPALVGHKLLIKDATHLSCWTVDH